MAPRVLILGSSGQLGVELSKILNSVAEVTAVSRAQVDLRNSDQLRSAIRAARPQFLVNAAAYTAVDKAESEPDMAHAVNSVAPGIMAEEALRLGAWFIHFSTDYVFDGTGAAPWSETDSPNPLNVYGRTKLEGEQAIVASNCRHLIFRTSWVYAAHGTNFLRSMLRLASQRPRLTIVDDQRGAPTSANELARGVKHVIDRLDGPAGSLVEPGIYHMSCAGVTTWYGFAQAIFVFTESRIRAPELVPIPSEQYPTPAKRPHNSVLNCAKLNRVFGLCLIPWQDALAQVISELPADLLEWARS